MKEFIIYNRLNRSKKNSKKTNYHKNESENDHTLLNFLRICSQRILGNIFKEFITLVYCWSF